MKDPSRTEDVGTMVSEPETAEANTPILDRYGRDITRAAREGRLLPFVESERTRNTLRQLLKVLVMPTKNNPVLVGEAGVGKTAIVEALAERVALGRDRRVLAGKRVVELSMAELVITSYSIHYTKLYDLGSSIAPRSSLARGVSVGGSRILGGGAPFVARRAMNPHVCA